MGLTHVAGPAVDRPYDPKGGSTVDAFAGPRLPRKIVVHAV